MPKMPQTEKITEEAFNKCFFSKGYYMHEKCEYETISEDVVIECEDCIRGIRSQRLMDNCSCKFIKIEKSVCCQCKDIRNHIVYLEDELDSIIYNLSYDIKKLQPCNTMLDRIKDISIQLRVLSSYLLSREQGTYGSLANPPSISN